MTDSKRQKSDKGIVQRFLDMAFQLWPVSILLMAFTFLSRIEEVELFSKYLSQFLKEWKAFLHGVIEFPVNTLLRIFHFPEVNIPSPWPEVITLISLLLFTCVRRNQLSKIKWAQVLVRKHLEFRDYMTQPILEKITVKSVFLYLVGNFIGIILWLWALVLIAYVMFSDLKSPLEVLLAVTLTVGSPIFLSLGLPKRNESFDFTIEIQGYVVTPAVILISFCIVVLATALEIIVPNAISFIDRTN